MMANGDSRVSTTEDQDENMTEVGEKSNPPGEPPDKWISGTSKAASTEGVEGMEANGVSMVPNSEDHDASMTDVGERTNRPGEPLDKGISWASKAASTVGGGMPVPEVLIEDSFVSNRLHVEFPNGEDGEPSITIENEVLEAMNGLWKKCMIVRVLGRNVAISAVNRKLRELWNPKGRMYVMDLPRQFFMVRFEREEEYLAALTGGPWRAFGSYLMVRAWSPEFDPLKDNIATTPVWIRLTNIPVNFYHRSILMGIAKGLGKPIRVDPTTLNFERARFARICVEVNLAKPLKGTVLINGDRYFVSYEGLTEICSKCGVYGHLVHGCPRTIAERMAISMTLTEVSAQVKQTTAQVPQPQDDGFIQARGSRRGAQALPRSSTGMTGKSSKGETDRSNSEMKETKKIVLSNKYGSLDIDRKMGEVGDDVSPGEEDRESQKMNIKDNKGKGVLQEKESIVFGGTTSVPSVSKWETKERWMGNKKTMEGARGKLKKINNRPVRGLIFGPTKGEINLSESGKRLRVENNNVGRQGGAFRDNMEKAKAVPKTPQLCDEELENPMDGSISEAEQRTAGTQTNLQEDGRVLSLA